LTIPAGMGARETIRALLQLDPDIRAIVSSGYANDPILLNFKEYGFRGVIAKPFTMEELNRVLLSVIKES